MSLADYCHAVADLTYGLAYGFNYAKYQFAQAKIYCGWQYTKWCIDYPPFGTAVTVIMILFMMKLWTRSKTVAMLLIYYWFF